MGSLSGAAPCLLLVGCGHIGFDRISDEPPGDTAAPRCDPAKPFGAPVRLAQLSSPAAEIGVELADDALAGFLWSNRVGPDRIYETKRARLEDELGPPVLVSELAAMTGESDRDPCPSGDGLSVVFASLRPGGGGGDWDLWLASRPSRTSPFEAPVPLTTLNDGAANWGPYLSSSALAVYYVDGTDLVVARRTDVGAAFGNRQVLTTLNTPDAEFEPTVTPDELTIFFASSRPGGFGGLDIWHSQRASAADLFPAPVNLTELNTGGDDIPSWISPDLCELHLTQTNGTSSWDLYVARRPP